MKETDSKIKHVKGEKGGNFERGTANVFGLQRVGCLRVFSRGDKKMAGTFHLILH